MRAILALGAILFSAAAAAQSGQNLGVGPDNGFFRPTPGNDPSLTHSAPAPQGAFPAQIQPAPIPQPAPVTVPVYVPVQVATPPAALPSAPAPVEKAEQQLDRAQREAEEAVQKAKQQPVPINGAFSGQTNEKDR